MEAKDVALLGFVSSAQDYIQKHLNDETKLGDLKQVNIGRLKEELLAQLKFFAGKEDINDLIEAGNAAFEEFKKEKLEEKKTNSVIDQLGQIFDVNFDDDIIDDEEVAASKINDLLKAYDTDDTEEKVEPLKTVEPEVFEPKVCIDEFISKEEEITVDQLVKLPQVSIDKFIKAHAVHSINNDVPMEEVGNFINKVKEEKEPTISIDQFIVRYKEPEVTIDEFIERYKEALVEEKNTVTIDEFIKKYKEIEKTLKNDAKVSIDSFIKEESDIEEDIQEEENIVPYEGADGNFGLEEDDEFLKAIAEAASKSNEELAQRTIAETEVVVKEVEENVPEIKAPVHPKQMDEVYSDVVNNEPLSSRLSSYRQNDKMNRKEFEKKKEEFFTNIVQAAVKAAEGGNIRRLSDELKNYGRPVVKPENIDTVSNSVYIENPGLKIIEEREKREKLKKQNIEYIDDSEASISTRISNLKLKQNISVPEVVAQVLETEEVPVAENYGVSDALKDLKNFAKAKLEEKKKEEFDPNADIYQNIANMYEHLNLDFIKSAYALKIELAETLKENQTIVLLHRIRFSSLDRLHAFVEIAVSHDYAVNVDEKQMIVDVFKDYVNVEGLVLGTIYTIANQAALLEGEYEGYRIIDLEGK